MKADRLCKEATKAHRKGDISKARKFYEHTLKVVLKHASARICLATILHHVVEYTSKAMQNAGKPAAPRCVGPFPYNEKRGFP